MVYKLSIMTYICKWSEMISFKKSTFRVIRASKSYIQDIDLY